MILLVIMFNCVIMAFPPNKLKNATSPTDFFAWRTLYGTHLFLRVRDKFQAYGLVTSRTRGTSSTLWSCAGDTP